MGKLYEIAERYKNLEDLLDSDNAGDAETVIKLALDDVQEEFDIKAENIAKMIRAKEVDVNGIDEEIKRLQNRKKTDQNKILYLKQYLFEHMKLLKKDKIKGKLFTLSIKKTPPKVAIEEEEIIPKEYWRPQPDILDKKSILDALKNNMEIPGVKLEQGTTLGIR